MNIIVRTTIQTSNGKNLIFFGLHSQENAMKTQNHTAVSTLDTSQTLQEGTLPTVARHRPEFATIAT